MMYIKNYKKIGHKNAQQSNNCHLGSRLHIYIGWQIFNRLKMVLLTLRSEGNCEVVD